MKFTIFPLLLSLSAMVFANPVTVTNTESAKTCTGIVCWVKIEQVNKANLILAGKEYHGGAVNYNAYVGRINHLDGLIPGKWVPDCGGVFYYSHNELQFNNQTNFEVLEYPPGALSWIDSSNGTLPLDAIVAGNNPDTEENLYICRGMEEGNLIVGKYLHSLKSCIGPWKGQITIKAYEILALNSLGRLLNENQENISPTFTSKALTIDPKKNNQFFGPRDISRSSVNIYNVHVTF